MKQLKITLAFIFVLQNLIAQNTFPWPASGQIGIGTSTPGTLLDVGSAVKAPSGMLDSYILGIQSKTASTSTSGIAIGTYIYNEQTVALNGNIQGAYGHVITSNPSGIVTLSIGVNSYAEHTGNGTLTWQRGVQANVGLNGVGTITNSAAFLGNFANIRGSGNVTNGYGLYIGDFPLPVTNKYGVYIKDVNANNYFAGNVGIGVVATGSFKLAVEGKIGARELKVTLDSPWPDYVFDKKYTLPNLANLEQYLSINKHLPGIPSAAEVKENNGIEVGQMTSKLLEKVEELTLYVIQLKKENEEIKLKLKEISNK